MTQISSGFYLEATFFVFTESEKRVHILLTIAILRYHFSFTKLAISVVTGYIVGFARFIMKSLVELLNF